MNFLTRHSTSKESLGDSIILVSCFFYGIAFPLQKYAMLNGIGPITFSALRLVASSILMVLFRPVFNINFGFRSTRNDAEIELSNQIFGYGTVQTTRSPRIIQRPIQDRKSLRPGVELSKSRKGRSKSLDLTYTSQYILKAKASCENFENIHKPVDHNIDSAENCSGYGKNWSLLLSGSLLGINDAIAAILQQISMVTISGGQSAFITSLYVVAVPTIEYVVPCLGGSISITASIAAALSVLGVYLLSGCTEDSCFTGVKAVGVSIAFCGMFFWSCSIIIAGKATKSVDCVDFTCIMFFVSAACSLFAAFVFESENWIAPYNNITNNWIYILSVGATEALACTLCNIGQKYADDSRAAVIMSLESVLAAFVCYIFLGESLTPVEIAGCIIVLLSILLTIFEKEFPHDNVFEACNDEEAAFDAPLTSNTISATPFGKKVTHSPSFVITDDVSLKILGEHLYVVVSNNSEQS